MIGNIRLCSQDNYSRCALSPIILPEAASLRGTLPESIKEIIFSLPVLKRLENAVYIRAAYDYNDAFKVNPMPKMLSGIYKLHSGIAENGAQFCDILKQATTLFGRPVDVLAIQAHGWPKGLTLGKNRSLTINNLESVAGCIKEHLIDNAPILMRSCSTGKKVSTGINFATKMAVATGHPVQAATQVLYGNDCHIRVNNITRFPIMSCINRNGVTKDRGKEYISFFNPYKVD